MLERGECRRKIRNAAGVGASIQEAGLIAGETGVVNGAYLGRRRDGGRLQNQTTGLGLCRCRGEPPGRAAGNACKGVAGEVFNGGLSDLDVVARRVGECGAGVDGKGAAAQAEIGRGGGHFVALDGRSTCGFADRDEAGAKGDRFVEGDFEIGRGRHVERAVDRIEAGKGGIGGVGCIGGEPPGRAAGNTGKGVAGEVFNGGRSDLDVIAGGGGEVGGGVDGKGAAVQAEIGRGGGHVVALEHRSACGLADRDEAGAKSDRFIEGDFEIGRGRHVGRTVDRIEAGEDGGTGIGVTGGGEKLHLRQAEVSAGGIVLSGVGLESDVPHGISGQGNPGLRLQIESNVGRACCRKGHVIRDFCPVGRPGSFGVASREHIGDVDVQLFDPVVKGLRVVPHLDGIQHIAATQIKCDESICDICTDI